MTRWRISAGTASILGNRPIKSDALPTTAYIMLGDQCKNNCRFCTQSTSSQARSDLLSRVTWPSFEEIDITPRISPAYLRGKIKRICLQVVDDEAPFTRALETLEKLLLDGPKPICVSSRLQNIAQAQQLISAGAQRICLAIDAATPELYQLIKGTDWLEKIALLQASAKAFPGRVTTHLIIGLGETEKEAVRFIMDCISRNITVGLFAFTPIPGTDLGQSSPPPIDQYRRIQVAHYLLKKGYPPNTILFDNGKIIGYNVPDLGQLLSDGKAFRTTGCSDCNRPYYNERPGSVLYNYPRPLTPEEIKQALLECGIGGELSGLASS